MSIWQGIQLLAQSPDTAHLQQIHYGFCESHHIHGHGHCIGKGKNQTDGPPELWSQTAWYHVVSSSWGKTNKSTCDDGLLVTISCFDKRGGKKGRHVLFIYTLCPSVMSIKILWCYLRLKLRHRLWPLFLSGRIQSVKYPVLPPLTMPFVQMADMDRQVMVVTTQLSRMITIPKPVRQTHKTAWFSLGGTKPCSALSLERSAVNMQ